MVVLEGGRGGSRVEGGPGIRKGQAVSGLRASGSLQLA